MDCVKHYTKNVLLSISVRAIWISYVWNVARELTLILQLFYLLLSAPASKLDMSEDVDVVDDGGASVDVTTPTAAGVTAGTVGIGRSSTTTYRYSKKKTPVVHLEKLNVITDSNGM
jgi:hypothetical protein